MTPPKFSLTITGSKQTARTPKSQPIQKRAAALGDSDDDNDGNPQPQSVSHFDQAAGGAIHVDRIDEKKKPLVIKAQGNRNWQDEARRSKGQALLPPEARNAQTREATSGDSDAIAPIKYGLNIVDHDSDKSTESPVVTVSNAVPPVLKTDDQLALEALLGEEPKSTLVLPATRTEEESFQKDYRNAPDMATLEEYAAVPVAEFGAALLRGMGWKDGDPIGRQRTGQPAKPRLLDKRPALLGIGAKEDAAVGVELGAWGKSGKGKRKLDQIYTPVLLRNAKTGEQLTEEELKMKLEQEKLVERQKDQDRRDPGKRRDNYHGGRSRDEERTDKNRERDHDKSRNRDRDRGRDRDRDRYRRDRSSSSNRHKTQNHGGRSDRHRRSRSRHREKRPSSSSSRGSNDDRKRERRRNDKDRHRDRDRDRDRGRHGDYKRGTGSSRRA